jgi:hypothetical protein
VESFSATLLVEGGGNQLIYSSCSHLLKTSMRRRKGVHTRALARLASLGGAKGAGNGTCVNSSPKSGFSPCGSAVSFCGFWSFGLMSPKWTQLGVPLVIVFHEVGFPDYISSGFWSFGLMSPKWTQLGVPLVIVFHEVGFPDYISRPPATLKRIKSTTRVLPLLTVGPSLPRLHSPIVRVHLRLGE